MNNVQLSGRIAKDFEVKWTQSGKQVVQFPLAVQREFKNASGQYDADFINIVAWEKTAEIIGNNFSKGDLIMIPQGRLQVRTYEDNNGQKRYMTEVIATRVEFMESKKAKDARQNGANAHSAQQTPYPNNSYSQQQNNAPKPNPAANQQSAFDSMGDYMPFNNQFDTEIPF